MNNASYLMQNSIQHILQDQRELRIGLLLSGDERWIQEYSKAVITNEQCVKCLAGN